MAPRLTEPTAADWAAVADVVVAHRLLFADRLAVAVQLCRVADTARYGASQSTRDLIRSLASEWDHLTDQIRIVTRVFSADPERGPGAHRAWPPDRQPDQ